MGRVEKITEEIQVGESRSIDAQGIEDRIYGAIVAAACANSLGGSCIGLSRKEILVSTGLSSLKDFSPGLSRSRRPEHQPGNLLADSLLALTFAESLIENTGQFEAEDLKSRFGLLLESKDFLGSSPKAISLAFLRKAINGLPSIVEEQDITDITSAIISFPSGCLPGLPKTDDPIAMAIEQSAMSHLDKRVQAAAAVLADSIHYFILGQDLSSEEAVRSYVQRELAVARKIDERFADAWDGIAPDLDYAKPGLDLPYSLVNAEASVTELVPTAVGIFLIFRHSLEEAIGAAALSGGETDSISIIVGALAGAYHGAGKIPERWLKDISCKERLDNTARQLCRFWH
jgi:ADP-ribosylglycohydrolase